MTKIAHILPIAPYAHSSTLVSHELDLFPSSFLSLDEIEHALSKARSEDVELCFPSHFLTCPQKDELRKNLRSSISHFRIQVQFGRELTQYQDAIRELSEEGFQFDLLFDRAPLGFELEKGLEIFSSSPRLIYLQNRIFPFFLERNKFPEDKVPAFNLYLRKKNLLDLFFSEHVAESAAGDENILSLRWISSKGSGHAYPWPEAPRDFPFISLSSRLVKKSLEQPKAEGLLIAYLSFLEVGFEKWILHLQSRLGLHLFRISRKIWGPPWKIISWPFFKIFWFSRYQYQTRIAPLLARWSQDEP